MQLDVVTDTGIRRNTGKANRIIDALRDLPKGKVLKLTDNTVSPKTLSQRVHAAVGRKVQKLLGKHLHTRQNGSGIYLWADSHKGHAAFV